MKKFSLILNIILVLVSLFFIVFANIQSKLAQENAEKSLQFAQEAESNQLKAEQEAANAREAEAAALYALKQLEICQNAK